MSLFTAEELSNQIAAYKDALLKLASSQSYTIETIGGTRRIVTRADLPEIRKTLTYLESEKQKLSTSSVHRRTYAKQGGRS